MLGYNVIQNSGEEYDLTNDATRNTDCKYKGTTNVLDQNRLGRS